MGSAIWSVLRALVGFGRRLSDRYWRRRWETDSAREFGVRGLLGDPASKSYRNDIDAYWRARFGRAVSPVWHLACAKVTGRQDVRYIPTPEWFEEILPFLNQLPLREAFRDKNLSDVFLAYPNAPKTVVKRMHGRYYGENNIWLSDDDAVDSVTADHRELVIKPSQTDEGYGIRRLTVEPGGLLLDGASATWADLEARYGSDFVVQELIEQHPEMARAHPASVNTVRIVTLRWRDDIRVLMTFVRFGAGGRMMDNAAAGGVCCGVDADGRLNATAIDIKGGTYDRHPTTGFRFSDRITIPNYDRVCALVLGLHKQLYHFDFVSWDIAIGVDGEPIFLEVNFRGVAHLYQFACGQPLLGESTDEILEAVRDRR